MLDKMLVVRAPADKLELEVSDEIWPLPKYSELLFMY
jgi:glutamine synthetase type III